MEPSPTFGNCRSGVVPKVEQARQTVVHSRIVQRKLSLLYHRRINLSYNKHATPPPYTNPSVSPFLWSFFHIRFVISYTLAMAESSNVTTAYERMDSPVLGGGLPEPYTTTTTTTTTSHDVEQQTHHDQQQQDPSTETTATKPFEEELPSRLTSRSFGSLRSARSGRSRRSTRSRDSLRSQQQQKLRVIYSANAQYDAWMVGILSLLPLLVGIRIAMVYINDANIAHFERSQTVWILSWSLIFIFGMYMMILPKQLNIRSNGTLGIKTSLLTYEFTDGHHVTVESLSSLGGPCCNGSRSWLGGIFSSSPIIFMTTSWTSLTTPNGCCLIRRRAPFWDVLVTPTDPLEFRQHYESVLTRLEIQRAGRPITITTTTTPTIILHKNGSNDIPPMTIITNKDEEVGMMDTTATTTLQVSTTQEENMIIPSTTPDLPLDHSVSLHTFEQQTEDNDDDGEDVDDDDEPPLAVVTATFV